MAVKKLIFVFIFSFLFIAGTVSALSKPSDFGLKEGDVITGKGDIDVFIVNDWGYKRLFLNPAIFGFYGHLGFAKVKSVNLSTRDSFITSGLFQNCETNDQRIYALEVNGEDTGILHLLNIARVDLLKQDSMFLQKVFCINTREFEWYPKSPISYTLISQIPNYNRVLSTPSPSLPPSPTSSVTPTPTPSPMPVSGSIVGFARSVTGGVSGATVSVTSLADSGVGTLRSALASGNQNIVFKVNGTIKLASDIKIRSSNITIDGSGADISITSKALDIQNSSNIIIRNIRFRDASDDCVRIWTGASMIAIDHNTFINCGDGNLDVTYGAHDITISNNIFASNLKSTLFKYNNPYNITLYRNLYINSDQRQPQISGATKVDMVNNVIARWTSYGTYINANTCSSGCTTKPTANLVGNYFLSSTRPHAALWIETAGTVSSGPVYIAGYSQHVAKSGTDSYPNVLPAENWTRATTDKWSAIIRSTPYDFGYALPITSAEEAYTYVRANAGVSPRTSIETGYANILLATP